MFVWSTIFFTFSFIKRFLIFNIINGFFSTLLLPFLYVSYYILFQLKSMFSDTIYYFFLRFFFFFKNLSFSTVQIDPIYASSTSLGWRYGKYIKDALEEDVAVPWKPFGF